MLKVLKEWWNDFWNPPHYVVRASYLWKLSDKGHHKLMAAILNGQDFHLNDYGKCLGRVFTIKDAEDKC